MRVIVSLLLLLFGASAAQAAWHRAESDNFIFYSDAEADSLRDFAVRLERFDRVLRQVSNVRSPPSPTKLRIFLVENEGDVRAFIPGFSYGIGGFYQPVMRGPYAVAPRESVGFGTYSATGENVLFHEYAHHFMYQYFPASYPTWYVEGFAEFYSTVRFREDGMVEIGLPVVLRAPELRYGDWVPVRQMLMNEDYPSSMVYAEGWLLTHLAAFNREVGALLTQYLNAMRDGKTGGEAYELSFGAHRPGIYTELREYWARRRFPGLAIELSVEVDPNSVRMTVLSEQEAAVARLYAMLEDRGLGASRAAIRDWPDDPGAHAELARAELADENFPAAIAAADAALALDDGHVDALIIKARALIEAMKAANATSADPRWTEARALAARANRANPDSGWALMT